MTKSWAGCLVLRMGIYEKEGKHESKGFSADFERYKTQFIFDIRAVIEMEDIPGELVINWDQTGIHCVQVSSWTMAREGSKQVEITERHDKRQIRNCCFCRHHGRRLSSSTSNLPR